MGGAASTSTAPVPRVSSSSKPLRSDMAIIKHARRGGVTPAIQAGLTVGMQSLVDDLQRDREAASGQGVRASHLATWTKFHNHALGFDAAAAGRTPVFPLTPDNIVLVAALLKAGDYRSYANYLSDMKGYHLDYGHAWTENLIHVGRWTTRSVLRGIGPARESQPIPLPLVMSL